MTDITLPNGNTLTPYHDGYIQVAVDIDVHDLIANDLEGVLDLMSEAATGSPLLMDINFIATEVRGDNTIRFIVTGDPSAILEG